MLIRNDSWRKETQVLACVFVSAFGEKSSCSLSTSTTKVFLVIILYDTILGFPQEIRCIWRRRFSLVTVSYIIIGYGTFVTTIMNILDAFYVLTSIPVMLCTLVSQNFQLFFLCRDPTRRGKSICDRWSALRKTDLTNMLDVKHCSSWHISSTSPAGLHTQVFILFFPKLSCTGLVNAFPNRVRLLTCMGDHPT